GSVRFDRDDSRGRARLGEERRIRAHGRRCVAAGLHAALRLALHHRLHQREEYLLERYLGRHDKDHRYRDGQQCRVGRDADAGRVEHVVTPRRVVLDVDRVNLAALSRKQTAVLLQREAAWLARARAQTSAAAGSIPRADDRESRNRLQLPDLGLPQYVVTQHVVAQIACCRCIVASPSTSNGTAMRKRAWMPKWASSDSFGVRVTT